MMGLKRINDRQDRIEKRIKVLECSHGNIQYHVATDGFTYISNRSDPYKCWTECADCGKTIKRYLSEIEMYKDIKTHCQNRIDEMQEKKK